MKVRIHNFKIKPERKAVPIFIIIMMATISTDVHLLNKYHEYEKPQEVIELTQKTRDTFYPKLYSDKNITSNAIETDERFKDIVVFERRDNMLANVISTVKNSFWNKDSEKLEYGTWLWTPIINITPEYRDSIISGASQNNINTIYLSIDSYLDIFVMTDGPEKEKKKKEFDNTILDFIIHAKKYNISVDAEAGWRNWAEAGHLYKAYAVLNYAIEFNKKYKEKLRGFQFDVEPYLLSSYKIDKEAVLGKFVDLIDQSVMKLDSSDLKLSVVIPEFYDSSSSETPSFEYRGYTGHTFDHLLRILDRRQGSTITVMSYRNFASGDDGSIDVSNQEIESADNHSTKIIIAQETGDVMPPYTTFHNTEKSYYDKQLETLAEEFFSKKSFGGFAAHYVNTFIVLD